ncbi:Origin recognition complex, subunit 1 [Blyttiomyces sp. JEL0837]|nr:Origin recognition complex, subunit 1 [Blyttiomyces sp. JEL0837]
MEALDHLRKVLSTSFTPDEMPCRHTEFASVYDGIYSALEKGGGECIYISGVPGTGKTATVRQVIKTLESTFSITQEDAAFNYYEINGMKLTDPQQAYSMFWKHMYPGSARVSPSHAADLLQGLFKEKFPNSKRERPIVLLLDELDVLITRKQNVIYNFFDWPRCKNSPLILIAVANTMDLPERLFTNKVNSRVGTKRIAFNAYGVDDLKAIIGARFSEYCVISPDAVEFCARKVAGMSGDARRALEICRRSIEVLAREVETSNAASSGTSTDVAVAPQAFTVTRTMIQKVIQEMFQSSSAKMLERLSLHETILLSAVHLVGKFTGQTEVSMLQVYNKYVDLCQHMTTEPGVMGEVLRLVAQLHGSRHVFVESGKYGDPAQRIKSGVAIADLSFALQNNDYTKLHTFLNANKA